MQIPVGCNFGRLFNKSSAANHDEYGQGDKSTDSKRRKSLPGMLGSNGTAAARKVKSPY